MSSYDSSGDTLEDHILNRQNNPSPSNSSPYRSTKSPSQATESDPLLNNRGRRDGRQGSDEPSWFQELKWKISDGAFKAKRWWINYHTLCICNAVLVLIIVMIILTMNWLGYFYRCSIPGDAEVVKFNYTIDSSKSTRLYHLLGKGVYGDVVVSQSQDPHENNILISGSIQTSKPEILKHVSTHLDIDSVPGRAQSEINVEMATRDLDRILKRECIRVKVDIVLPRQIRKFGDILIQSSYRGDVQVDIEHLRLDALGVLIERGDADIRASVSERIEVQSKTGRVKARVQAEKSVVVTAERDVELELTTQSLDLHARAVSIRSSAKTVLTQPFYGHFELSSSFWKPELRGSRRYLKVTHSDNHTMEGYFSSSWSEPWYLPRVEVKGTGARLEVSN